VDEVLFRRLDGVSPSFDRLFGGCKRLNIIPFRLCEIFDFGAIFRRVDNPTLPSVSSKNGGFNFKQQIQMGSDGRLGGKGEK